MTAPAGQGDAQSQAALGMMGPMFVLLAVMLLLTFNPGLRLLMADSAASVIEPTIPFHSDYFVPTVFIIGSSIMIVNTVIRGFFMDPITQVHIGHRNKQISKQLRDAQAERDTARADKMRRLQMELMPDQMAMQSSMMKPMMFTIIFIIGIFSWMAESAAGFRVGYVSLPWQPMWGMMDTICWIFPAWVITYIAMSAPLGRIIDRHIKIIRFGRHPLVLEGTPIPEPLLHLLKEEEMKSSATTRRSQRRSRDGPRKKGNSDSRRGGNLHSAPPQIGTTCPDCSSTMVNRTSSGRLRCSVCRNEWR